MGLYERLARIFGAEEYIPAIAMIFTRDLRLVDNSALNEAAKRGNVLPIFIFNDKQVGQENTFRSNNAIQFMIESLRELSKGCPLITAVGKPEEILRQLFVTGEISECFISEDYTPFAKDRATKLMQTLPTNQIEDYLLQPAGKVVNTNGETYKKFTPFYNSAKRLVVRKPAKATDIKWAKLRGKYAFVKSLDEIQQQLLPIINRDIAVNGGRQNAINILRNVNSFKNYAKNRNVLADNNTSHLSAYIKFGCVSIREVYFAFKGNSEFIKQLYWRDFYYNIIVAFPQVLSGKALKNKHNAIRWTNRTEFFQAWTVGTTGFPIVDAAMRQMNKTGWMHNRGRLIVSNVLIKTLFVDWRKGEKYFASMLVDYDPAVNNGNWQWSAGSGADSQPYFRVFNPWLQSAKFDPLAQYIKKWVPELKNVPAEDIHQWNEAYKKYPNIDYPSPITEYNPKKSIEFYDRFLYEKPKAKHAPIVVKKARKSTS